MRKRKIITTSKEIYDKFTMLYFSPEIILNNVKQIQVDKILKNINKNSKILSSEKIGKYIIIRKHGPINFDIYYRF